jgi:hypothetical protein
MDSRNILTVLIVIFVAILLYNGLYFMGFVGNFGADSPLQPLPQDPRLQVPGAQAGASPAPRASGAAALAAANQGAVRSRSTVTAADLGLAADWGRDPFLTPRELWAIANYRPYFQTTPSTPPSGLYLSAIVMDSSGRRVAIINGDIVSVGQTFAGMQVVEMMRDAVVFEIEGNRHVVRMADAAVGLGGRGTATGRY